MPSIRLDELSPFGRLALQLDRELSELARAGGQMADVNLESDNGLDEGVRILQRVSQYGQSVAQTMQDFSKALDEAREKAEAATKLVAERAQVIQKRRQEADVLQEKLDLVKEAVRELGAGLSRMDTQAKTALSDEDKRRVAAELQRLQAPLAGFIGAVQAVKAEAAGAKFKRLERQAESMLDSLQATRRKIAQALAAPQS